MGPGDLAMSSAGACGTTSLSLTTCRRQATRVGPPLLSGTMTKHTLFGFCPHVLVRGISGAESWCRIAVVARGAHTHTRFDAACAAGALDH